MKSEVQEGRIGEGAVKRKRQKERNEKGQKKSHRTEEIKWKKWKEKKKSEAANRKMGLKGREMGKI